MLLWMTARGTGLAALVLLTASTCLGALGTRRLAAANNRVVLQYIHRSAGALGIGALLLHGILIISDTYANVGVTGALIPFTAGYRPTWVGLGTLALYCLVLVAGLGFARGRMAASPTGARIWRSTHLLAYVAWAMAILHGYTAGTDSGVSWVIALYVLCLISVVTCVWMRLTSVAGREDPKRDLPRAVGAVSANNSASNSMHRKAVTR